MSRSLEAALERALAHESAATAEPAGQAEIISEALAVIAAERERAEALRVFALQLLAVLGLPLPDGVPSPAEMGRALEVAQLTVAQAQRVPALVKLLEQREREARGSLPPRPKPSRGRF